MLEPQARAGYDWSTDEERWLIREIKEFQPFETIAYGHQRSLRAIEIRAQELVKRKKLKQVDINYHEAIAAKIPPKYQTTFPFMLHISPTFRGKAIKSHGPIIVNTDLAALELRICRQLIAEADKDLKPVTRRIRLTLKVHYLKMFNERGYFHQIIRNIPSQGDGRRVSFDVLVPIEHVKDVCKYASWYSLYENETALRKEITETQRQLTKLQKRLELVTNYNN